MADRGTAYAADATQYEFDVFAHVMEPLATFPEADWGVVSPIDADLETDVSTWVDVWDPVVDWGDQFDQPHGGDGYYMQEPNTTEKKLQGAPSGSTTVAGALGVQMTLNSATIPGSTAVAPATMLKDVALTTPGSTGKATITATLRNTKVLVGQADGSTAIPDTRQFGPLRSYASAILADSPTVYAPLDETSGTSIFNHSSLGGAQVGSINSSSSRYANKSLTGTELGYSVRNLGLNLFLPDPTSPAYALDWWLLSQGGGTEVLQLAVNNTAGGFDWLALVTLNADGTLHFARGTAPGFAQVGVINDERRVEIDIPVVVNDGRPHYVAVSSDGSGLTAMVDGVASSMTAAPLEVATTRGNQFFPSKGGPTGEFSFAWFLDQIAYFGHDLTVEQMRTHYGAGLLDATIGFASGRASVLASLGFEGSEVDLGAVALAGNTLVSSPELQTLFDLGSAATAGVTLLSAADLAVTPKFNIDSDQIPRKLRRAFT